MLLGSTSTVTMSTAELEHSHARVRSKSDVLPYQNARTVCSLYRSPNLPHDNLLIMRDASATKVRRPILVAMAVAFRSAVRSVVYAPIEAIRKKSAGSIFLPEL
jgi:hypothetical protein